MVNVEGGVGNIVNRSMIAGIVSKQELGTVYGLLAILDAVLPFIGKSRLDQSVIHFIDHFSPSVPRLHTTVPDISTQPALSLIHI